MTQTCVSIPRVCHFLLRAVFSQISSLNHLPIISGLGGEDSGCAGVMLLHGHTYVGGLERRREATMKKSSVHPQGTLLMSKEGKKTNRPVKPPPVFLPGL